MFGVQHPLCFAPDPVAATVELQGSDPVDGLASSFLADAVVRLSCGEFTMIHQIHEHIRGDVAVRVTLREGMPVGVGEELDLSNGSIFVTSCPSTSTTTGIMMSGKSSTRAR